MTEQIKYRSTEESDGEDIVKLLDKVFSGWPRFDLKTSSLDHWKWKYVDNPFKSNIGFVSETDETVVGASHSYCFHIKILDEICRGTYSADNVVHPDYRRKGISKTIYKLQEDMLEDENIALDYWVTSNPFLIKMFMEQYELFPIPVMTMARIQDVDLHLKYDDQNRSWLLGWGYKVLTFVNKNMNYLKKDYGSGLVEISEITSFDARINDFWDNTSKSYSYSTERSLDFLNWRYCDPRSGGYKVNLAEEGGEILGYIVLRINTFNPDYQIGYVVDLLTLPDRYDAADALVNSAVEYFDNNNINIVLSLVCKGHPVSGVYN